MIRALCPTLWLALALLLWGLCFQSAFALAAEGLRSASPPPRARCSDATGAIIAVAPIPEAEGAVKVKVLLDDGRVKTLVVDAQSGEILDTRGARR